MLIRLKWLNNNDSTAVVQVFRSTAPIDTTNPGTAYATLPGDAFTYDDNNAVMGTTYYYAVSVSKGVKIYWTPVKTFTNDAVRGPGPSRVLLGDDRLGYMGKLTTADFIDVAKAFNMTAAASTLYANITWHKFIRKNKIIYVADRPLASGTNTIIFGPSQRRVTGITSGLSWNFDTSSWPGAGRQFIVAKDAFNFHCRTVRGLPDDWDGSTITDTMVQNSETEFNELIGPMLAGEFYTTNKVGCVRLGAQLANPAMGPICCAEMFANGAADPGSLVRVMHDPAITTPTGAWAYINTHTRSAIAFFKYKLLNFVSTSAVPTSTVPATGAVVWPVFELIE